MRGRHPARRPRELKPRNGGRMQKIEERKAEEKRLSDEEKAILRMELAGKGDRALSGMEAAYLLGTTASALQTKRQRPGPNPIPYVKVGGSVRYMLSAIRQHLEANTYDWHGERRLG